MKLLFLIFFFSLSLFASVGKISALNGKIIVDREQKQLEASIGFLLEEKDLVISDDKSKAQITMNDGTVLSIGKSSKLNINEYIFDQNSPENSKANFQFVEGTFKSITGAIGKIAPERFKLETKSASIGIRGTIVVGSQKMIACTHGKITVTSAGVTRFLNAGMMTNTETGKAPTLPTQIQGNLVTEIEGEENSQEKTPSQQDNKNSKNEMSTNTNNPNSFDNVSTSVNNTSTQTTLTNKIEDKLEKTKVTISNLKTLPFYSIDLRFLTSNSNSATTTFKVGSDGSNVKISTYGASTGISNSDGLNPMLKLFKKNSDGTYSPYSNGEEDENWIKAESGFNAMLNLTLEEGDYKIEVTTSSASTIHEAKIRVYFSSTNSLTFDDTSVVKYTYNTTINNKAYLKLFTGNSITAGPSDPSVVNYDDPVLNKTEFKALTDSDVGASIYIADYGIFVTVSDSFNNEKDIFLNNTEVDDGSSWGYWTNNVNELSSIQDSKSVWVTGNQVTPAQDLKATFKGQVIGGTSNSKSIIVDSNNLFKASIDIGAAKITDSLIQFQDSSGKLWSGSFNTQGTNNINTQGFSSSISGIGTTGSLSGSYYGTNSTVQSIGGSFEMSNSGVTANGVFKAGVVNGQ